MNTMPKQVEKVCKNPKCGKRFVSVRYDRGGYPMTCDACRSMSKGGFAKKPLVGGAGEAPND